MLTEPSLKSWKTKVKIHAYSELALSCFEQTGPRGLLSYLKHNKQASIEVNVWKKCQYKVNSVDK